MENDVYSLLEETGMTKTEAATYITLLKRGPSTAYRIAKEAHIYKANTYAALENLSRKGLVSVKDSSGKKMFTALPPEEIVQNLERQKEKLHSIIPLIERHFGEDYEELSVFTGLSSFFNLLYKLLEKKQPIYVFDIPSFVPEIVQVHINQFHKERIKQKVQMYHLYDYDAKKRIDYLNKLKYTHAKQNRSARHSLVSTLICGDTILLINWKKDMKVIKIVDGDAAETYRKQFHMLLKDAI